jgi:hypothetical protein
MRRTVSSFALIWLTAASASAQEGAPTQPREPDVVEESEPHGTEPGVLRPIGTEPGQSRDLGRGVYAFLGAQLNFRVGELTEDLGGSFDFETANVAGVPDALLGIRYERWTIALGFNWTQVSAPRTNFDPCTSMTTETGNEAALFGVLPTVRYDAFTTDRERARFAIGVTPVFLFSDRKTEFFTGTCPGGPGQPGERDTQGATDAVLGFDVNVGGRYHLFDPLILGVQIGLTHLWFIPDNGPLEMVPTTETTTFYFGLSLSLELPL